MKRVPFIGAAATLLATAVVMGPMAHATYPGTNGRLVFPTRNASGHNPDLYSANPDGTGRQRLTRAKGPDLCPAVSALGDKVAFCSGRSGAFEIWVMGIDGSAQQQVTHLGSVAIFPDFDPTGLKLAFSGHRPNTNRDDIYVTGLDGVTLTRLTKHHGENDYPAYSPDGTKIAFESNRSGTWQVWVMAADGSSPVQLTNTAAGVYQVPDWSPDGSKISYTANDATTGLGDVYVMNADGSNQVQLTHTSQNEFGTAWSPDGTQIAFTRGAGGSLTRPIYIMNADGSNPHPLIPGLFGYVPSWQPVVAAPCLIRGELSRASGARPVLPPPCLQGRRRPPYAATGIDLTTWFETPQRLSSDGPGTFSPGRT